MLPSTFLRLDDIIRIAFDDIIRIAFDDIKKLLHTLELLLAVEKTRGWKVPRTTTTTRRRRTTIKSFLEPLFRG